MSPDYQIPGRVPEDGVPREAVSDYWRERFSAEPYYDSDLAFEDYEPGYRFAYNEAGKHRGKRWEDVEPTLRTDWDRFEGRGQSTWENVKDSVRDAWDNLTGKR